MINYIGQSQKEKSNSEIRVKLKKQKSFFTLLRNIVSVLLGRKSWVSYHSKGITNTLPVLKEGVFSPVPNNTNYTERTLLKLNMLYAKEYRLKNDFDILLRNLTRLG